MTGGPTDGQAKCSAKGVEHKLRDMLLGTPQRGMRPRRTKPYSNAHLRIDTIFVMHTHTTVGHKL